MFWRSSEAPTANPGGESLMKLSVIGCGYVGLVTGSCLAEAGHEVIATDNDAARIAALQAGKVPIYEPNLDRVLENAVADGSAALYQRLRRIGALGRCGFHLRGHASAGQAERRTFPPLTMSRG